MERTSLIVLIAVLIAATAFGLYRRRTDGRLHVVGRRRVVRAIRDDAPPAKLVDPDAPLLRRAGPHGDVVAADLGTSLGTQATLVQFSSAFCAPCRATRRILEEVTGMVDGVIHVEIDAEANLDLVRRLDIRRTPTVLVLNNQGHIVRRAVGAPRKADVIAALGQVIDA
jgi:thiol-disulfide isomerase/thioredoxin